MQFMIRQKMIDSVNFVSGRIKNKLIFVGNFHVT